MSKISELMVRILGDASGFSAEMKKANYELLRADDHLNKNLKGFEKFGARMSSVGAGLTAAITLPIVGVGVQAVKAAQNFEDAMKAVSARGEIYGKSLEQLEQQALKLGAETMFSSTEVARGMEIMAAAGFKTTQIMEAMPGVLSLASAGGLGLAEATEIAANSLFGFQLPAARMGKVADVIAKAANSGALSVQEFGLSMKYVGSSAKAMGLSLEEVAAAITLMSNQGVKGEQAGTSLRGAFRNLLAPTKSVRAALNELGISTRDSSGRILPLAEILDKIRSKTTDASYTFRIFGSEAASGMQTLLNLGGDALRKMTGELEKADGSAAKAEKTLQSGISGALEYFSGSVDSAAIKLGKVLAPYVIDAAKLLEKLADAAAAGIDMFSKLPKPIQAAAVGFTALLAAAGPVIFLAGQLMSSLTTLTVGLNGASLAAGGLRLALLALPWVGVAAGIATLVGYLATTERTVSSTTGAVRELEITTNRFGKALDETAVQVKSAQMSVQDYVLQMAKAKDRTKEFVAEAQRLGFAVREKRPEYEGLLAAVRAMPNPMDAGAAAAKRKKAALDEASGAVRRNTRALAEHSEEVKKKIAITKEFIDPLNWELLRKGFLTQAEAIEATKQRMAGWRQELQESLRAKMAWLNAADQIPDIVRNPTPTPVPKVPTPRFPGDDYDRGSEADMIPITPAGQARKAVEGVTGGIREANQVLREMKADWQNAWRAGGAALTNLITHGGKFKDVVKEIGRNLVGALINAPLEAAMKQLGDLLASLGQRVLKLAIDHLPRLGAALGKVLGSVTGAVGAVGTAAGTASSAGGTVAGAAGSIAAGVAGGIVGIVGAIGSVVSAVSGVISNFQLARQENTLNAIEKEVRYSQIHLGYILGKANEFWPWMKFQHDRLAQIVQGGLGVYSAPDSFVRVIAAGGIGVGATSTVNVSGNFIGFRDLDDLVDAIATRLKARGV
jgi:TP901 family phage tail tape measure protein